jgi:hypothetical protein
MLTMPIVHGIQIYKAHNCMSFVSKVIELSNTVKLEKKYYKYNIKEIDNLLTEYLLTECYLEKNHEDIEYMKRNSFIFNLKLFLELNCKLIYRILFRGNENYE